MAKFNRLAIFTVILGIFLWVGYLVGINIPSMNIPFIENNPNIYSSQPHPANGQRNILIIGVDRINTSDSKLISLWLVLVFPNQYRYTLIPLLPGEYTKSNNNISQSFAGIQLEKNKLRDNSYIARLVKDKIWWDEYLIIDEIGMIRLMDYFGGVQLDGDLMTGAQVISRHSYWWDDPNVSLSQQIEVVQWLCQSAPYINNPGDPPDFHDIFNRHIDSSMSIDDLTNEVTTILSNSTKIKCDIPTLEINQP